MNQFFTFTIKVYVIENEIENSIVNEHFAVKIRFSGSFLAENSMPYLYELTYPKLDLHTIAFEIFCFIV